MDENNLSMPLKIGRFFFRLYPVKLVGIWLIYAFIIIARGETQSTIVGAEAFLFTVITMAFIKPCRSAYINWLNKKAELDYLAERIAQEQRR